MDEQFLHYIWKYQKFDKKNLTLVNGETLSVFNQGNHNHDSGPDFEEARIKVSDLEWAGQIEIHINSSDWYNHGHQNDEAYENVILHVVWNHNKDISIKGTLLSTLELKKIVDKDLLSRYQNHIGTSTEIPCSNSIQCTKSMTISSMLNRALISRLENKAKRILNLAKKNNNDWDEVTYATLSSNFGFAVNKDSFMRLSEILPFKKLKKVLSNQKHTEALIFGQSGFLIEEIDDYQKELKSEYEYLVKKHTLPDQMVKHQWKFGKLRPANFPSVRLAQLSSLLHHNQKLFSTLIEAKNINDLKEQLMTPVSLYWQEHYDFAKKSKRSAGQIGKNSFDNILINTVAPLLAAYSEYTANQQFMDQAIELLESIAPEENRITKKWKALDVQTQNAFDSQALIELYQSYCANKQCLSCNIGVEILNK